MYCRYKTWQWYKSIASRQCVTCAPVSCNLHNGFSCYTLQCIISNAVRHSGCRGSIFPCYIHINGLYSVSSHLFRTVTSFYTICGAAKIQGFSETGMRHLLLSVYIHLPPTLHKRPTLLERNIQPLIYLAFSTHIFVPCHSQRFLNVLTVELRGPFHREQRTRIIWHHVHRSMCYRSTHLCLSSSIASSAVVYRAGGSVRNRKNIQNLVCCRQQYISTVGNDPTRNGGRIKGIYWNGTLADWTVKRHGWTHYTLGSEE